MVISGCPGEGLRIPARQGDAAAAEMIGMLILVTLFVSVIAILGVFLFSQPPPQKIPAVNIRFVTDGGHITIRHDGGDTLPEGSYQVRINGETLYSGSVIKSPSPAGSWTIGETLTLVPSGLSPSSYIDVVYSDGSTVYILAAQGTPNSSASQPAAPTSQTIVLNAGKAAYVESGGSIQFRVTGAYSTITVNGATYALKQGDTVRLVVEGNEYGSLYSSATAITTFSFSDVSFYQNGLYMNRGAVSSTYVSGYDQFRSTLNLYMPPASAWTSFIVNGTALINGLDSSAIRISGLGSTINLAATSGNTYYSGGASGYQFVLPPAPLVNGITPGSGTAGSTVSITDLSGSDFDLSTPPVVKLQKGTSAITATSVNVLSSSRIQCTFSLAGAETGQWDVVVVNPDGQSGTAPGLFAINPGPLTASFTYTLPSSNVLHLTDTSTGGPVSGWDWDFGDGATHSTVQNPPDHMYSTGSMYTVKLTVTNGSSQSSAQQAVLVTVPPSHTTTLNAAKGAYIESGSVMQFHMTGSYSTITVNGTAYALNQGDMVRLVFNNNEYGSLYSTPTSVSTFSFGNISFYRNGVLLNRGTVSSIWVSGYDQSGSTLNLYMPSAGAWTSFSVDGTSIISGQSSSAVRITGLGGTMGLSSTSGNVYYAGSAAGYQVI